MILRKTLSRLVAIAPRRERVAAPLIALLLVSTAVGAPIGTAAAASSTEECSGVDAWMHAETAIANAYKNGSSKAVAKSKAKTAIANYYSRKQLNRIERWNVTVTSYNTLYETAQNQSGISAKRFLRPYPNDADRVEVGLRETRTIDVTLANGTVVHSKAVVYEMKGYATDGDSGYSTVETRFSVKGTKILYEHQQTDIPKPEEADSLGVMSPSETHDKIRYVNATKTGQQFERSNTLNSDLQAEVDPFVNGTWTAFENGQIEASDVISRNNLMFRYGTDALNNSNASLYDSTAALSTMGLATPNINSTGTMTVEYDGVEYTGMVLAKEAPGGSWNTGTTYNTSEIGGVVVLATTDGERIDMEGEFTLTEMKNQDGDQIEETQATKVVYKTSNTSELLDKMDRIIELRQQIEATKPKASSGGGDSGDSGGNGFLKAIASFLGISAGAAAVVLLGVAVVVYRVYTP